MSLPSAPASAKPAFPQLPGDHPAQDYGALPARELLKFVQMASSQPQDRDTQIIFTAFYYRYYAYLCRVVWNYLGFVYDRDAQREIVDDALAAFFRTSWKLKLPAAESDDSCDRIIRAWLGRLVRWKASDARSFQLSFGRDVIDPEELDAILNSYATVGYGAAQETGPTPENRDVEVLAQWMKSLREIERDVLRTYFLDDHPGRKSGRLPDGIARRLADKHKTTTSNIRHLKSKLQQQIREKFPGR